MRKEGDDDDDSNRRCPSAFGTVLYSAMYKPDIGGCIKDDDEDDDFFLFTLTQSREEERV